MSTKLIQTKDYLLLIDEEVEIKEGDYYFSKNNNIVTTCDSKEEAKECAVLRHNDFKIIAYYPLTKESKKLDLPLLPPFEEDTDIFSLMDKETQQYYIKNPEGFSHFISGYKAAQSKQFSLEDLKKAIQMAREADSIDGTVDLHIVLNYPNADNSDLRIKWTEEEIIQSLSTQRLPKEFKPSIQIYDFDHGIGRSCIPRKILKTTTNSEGKQVLVGTYVY